jgi:nitrate reductase NapE component
MDNSSRKHLRKNHSWRVIAFVIVGVFLLCAIGSANAFGFWWFTILTGSIPGILLRRGRVVFPIALLIGGLGWGAGLAYQSFFLPISQVASVAAGIIGIGPANSWVMIAATLLLGALLCASGAWFCLALKSFFLLSIQSRITTHDNLHSA